MKLFITKEVELDVPIGTVHLALGSSCPLDAYDNAHDYDGCYVTVIDFKKKTFTCSNGARSRTQPLPELFVTTDPLPVRVLWDLYENGTHVREGKSEAYNK